MAILVPLGGSKLAVAFSADAVGLAAMSESDAVDDDLLLVSSGILRIPSSAGGSSAVACFVRPHLGPLADPLFRSKFAGLFEENGSILHGAAVGVAVGDCLNSDSHIPSLKHLV